MKAVRLAGATLMLAGTLSVAPAVGPCAGVAHAQEVHRAGLVVQFGDRPAKSFCVEFTEASITGLDLIERTGLPVTLQDYGGGNIAVCAIDGEGCAYPRTPCFCRCANLSACTIWGFYRLDDAGAWRFSDVGAAVTDVKDGEVHGWRWGKSTTSGGSPPDDTTLERVCAIGTHISAKTVATSAQAPRSPSPWPAIAAFAGLVIALTLWSRRMRARRERQ